jgi:hypothetical protein
VTIGVVALIAGILIGAVVGLVIGNIPLGSVVGFSVALVYLLIASWMDRRLDKQT